VTLDAMGAQKDIAQTIRDEKADYVLRVKANQGHLYEG
jgi:predicted transposase YbfD/YdcC